MNEHGLMVLVVDDEEQVRRFICNTLKAGGFRVLEAAGGLEAISLAFSYAADIVLVVLDIMMPDLSGLDFATQLQLEHPTIEILYISGHTDTIAVESISRSKPQSILHKPFTSAALVNRVQLLLANHSSRRA